MNRLKNRNPMLSNIFMITTGIIGLAIMGPIWIPVILLGVARQTRFENKVRNRRNAQRSHQQAYAYQQARDERVLAIKAFKGR